MNRIGKIQGSPLSRPSLFQMQIALKRWQNILTLDFVNLDPEILTRLTFKMSIGIIREAEMEVFLTLCSHLFWD